MADKIYRMLDSTIIYKGHEEIEAELKKRGIDFECPYDHVRIFVDAQSDIKRTIEASEVNVLEHVVGRTVALIGDNPLLVDLLTEEGYIVEQLSIDEALESRTLYDTVVAIGYGLDPVDKLSKWSTVLFNDGEIGFNYKFNDDTDTPKRNLAFRGNIIKRYKSGDSWLYDVAMLDTDNTIRLSSAELFPDNTIVVIRCDGLVVSQDNSISCLEGTLERSRFDVPHSFNDVLRIATDMNVIYQAARSYTVEDFITQYDLNKRYSADVAKLLRGYVGTNDEAIGMLEKQLPEAFIAEPETETEDEELSFEVTNLLQNDETHRVLGVVLEPNTPYGKDGIWFSAKTIEDIAHSYLMNNPTGALDHLDNSEVRIVESYVAKSNEIINGNKIAKGTWLVSCQVTDEVYEEIKEGKYTGLSIKGRAING